MERIYAILSEMSKQELEYLKIKLRNQPKKFELIEIALREESKHKRISDYKIELGYENNIKALYTLKHRLHKDLTNLKSKYLTSEIKQIELRISKLRTKVYSKDNINLSKEIKDLKEHCTRFEIIRGLNEINHVEYLINYPNIKNRKAVEDNIKRIENKEKLLNEAEIEFLRIVSTFGCLFYSSCRIDEDLKQKELAKLRSLYTELQLESTEFYLLVSEVTVSMQLAYNDTATDDVLIALNRIEEIYSRNYVQYRFPCCETSIESLFNKYYLIKEEKDNFLESLATMENNVSNIFNMNIFENTIIYYLFAKTRSAIQLHKPDQIGNYLLSFLETINIPPNNNKIQFYHTQLKAIANLYNQAFNQAQIILEEAYSIKLENTEANSSLLFENQLLQLSITIRQKDYSKAAQQIEIVANARIICPIVESSRNDFIRNVQQYLSTEIKALFDFVEILNEFQRCSFQFQLLDFRTIFIPPRK
jgi:hypothetical protein